MTLAFRTKVNPVGTEPRHFVKDQGAAVASRHARAKVKAVIKHALLQIHIQNLAYFGLCNKYLVQHDFFKKESLEWNICITVPKFKSLLSTFSRLALFCVRGRLSTNSKFPASQCKHRCAYNKDPTKTRPHHVS